MDWQGDGVTGETVVDIAKRLNVSCKLLDCNGQTVLSHTAGDSRDHHIRPICATIHGQHIWLYSGEEAIRSLIHTGDKGSRDPTRVDLKKEDDDSEEYVPEEWRELPHRDNR